MQPAFHRARIDLYASTMAELTTRTLSSWQDGATLDIHAQMTLLTRSIVSQCLFGSDVEDENRKIETTIDRLVNNFSKLTDSPILVPLFVPTPTNLRFRKDKERLDGLVYRFIERRRQHGGDGDDLMSMLLNARDDDGSGMTDQQVRDEVLTVLLAGHETTASALTWAFYLLTSHPQAAQRLADKADSALGDRIPSASDVPNLNYAEISWSIPRGAYLPFGAGPRQCIGKHFAMMEAVIILASIAQRFHLTRDLSRPVTPVPLVSIRPQDGLPVTVRQRKEHSLVGMA